MRDADEIIPASVENSATQNNDKANYGAGHAIDLDLDSRSMTVAGSEGTAWLKITLEDVDCVQRVIWYYGFGGPYHAWTCSDIDCNDCEGDFCSYFTLTVSGEGAVSDPSSESNCKYGDTVKVGTVGGQGFTVYEMAILGKPGDFHI